MKIFESAIITTALLLSACANTPNEPVFDTNQAIQIAGNLTTPNSTQFYAFSIPSNYKITEASEKLSQHLSSAAKAGASIAVISKNYKLAYEVLRKTLSEEKNGSLTGAHIIFIGDESNFIELENLAKASGATFKASTYRNK